MLFVAIILASAGYTLVYAGVKGDAYKVGGRPVWKEPWLPFFAVFSRRPDLAAATAPPSGGSVEGYLSAVAANQQPASTSNGSTTPAAVPPSQAGGAPGAPPSGLSGPGFQ